MTLAQLATWASALFLASSMFDHNVALRLLLLAASLVLAGSTVLQKQERLKLLPPIWLPFLVWALWAALSLAWSTDPARSLKEYQNELGYTAIALWSCFIAAQLPGAMRIFLGLAGVACAVLCALAIFDFVYRPTAYDGGWHGGPGNLSSALLMLMPCVLAAGWYAAQERSKRGMVVATSLVVPIVGAAYTTLNRTVWLGFTIEFLLLAGLVLRREPRGATRRLHAGAAVAAASVIAVCALIAAHVQAEREAIAPTAAIAKDLRSRIWPEVLERIEGAPLTGYGFGRGLLRRQLTAEFDNRQIWHAHNLFLDTALQTGVPGLLLFLALLATLASQGWRAVRGGASTDVTACGLALLGLVAGMAVRNMTDTLLIRQNALFFWAAAGVLMGWIELRRTPGAKLRCAS